MHLLHWLYHFFGLDNGSGGYYLAWSGPVADMSIFAGLYVALRKMNCHTKGCWRIAHHEVGGTPYKVCRKHHPDVPTKGATLTQIQEAVPDASEPPAC